MAKMGRPPKYTKEQAHKARNLQHKDYMVTAYENVQAYLPKGTNQRLKDAANFEGMSKRAYLMSAIENRLEITENLRKNS